MKSTHEFPVEFGVKLARPEMACRLSLPELTPRVRHRASARRLLSAAAPWVIAITLCALVALGRRVDENALRFSLAFGAGFGAAAASGR